MIFNFYRLFSKQFKISPDNKNHIIFYEIIQYIKNFCNNDIITYNKTNKSIWVAINYELEEESKKLLLEPLGVWNSSLKK